MTVATRRYVNVKTYKRSIGLCIMKDCRRSATVKATRRLNRMSMDVKFCASHTQQGDIT